MDGTLRASDPKTSSSTCSTMSATASVISSTASMERRSGRTRTRSIRIPRPPTGQHRDDRGEPQRQARVSGERVHAVSAERVEGAVRQVEIRATPKIRVKPTASRA